ncbi:MAG: hypothetical protein ABIN91_04900 [Mucilaginibacter sp.]|uniref:hypothetical protein n=1 Tax=Mucilaginibacter sp. TaxID=1882438 RepID=UPI003266C65F
MKTKILIFASLTGLLLSCKKEAQQSVITATDTVTVPTQNLSIDQVKSWYNSKATASLHTQSTQQVFSLSKLSPEWSKAQSFSNKQGNYWLMHFGGQPALQNVKQGYRKVAFLRDSSGQIQARILEIVPDVLYIQRKQKAETKDFTGRVFIYDEDYHLLGGKIYSQGKQIGRIKPQIQGAAPAKLQTQMVQVSVDCQWYDSNYIDSEGVATIYSENICTYSVYDDSFYPDMTGGGGGGTSGDPLGGGGGGGGNASSAPAVSNLPGEDHPKVSPSQYMNCFGSVPNNNATMQVTVYVQEPFPGTSFNYGSNSVGHTAISLTKSSGGTSVTQTLGFYPDATGKDKMNAPGKLVDNSGLKYNVSISYKVDAVQFANLVNYLNSSLPTYDITELNCTGYVYNACQYAGITLPNPYTTVGLPYPDGTQAQAMTPAGLGNSIQNMEGQPNVNTSGGNIPASHGPCNNQTP